MYISELKIQGFKTFVKKSVLNFGEGITTVVGPNGCGKTNIVDAIRWVLGEQKSSVLRGGKLEDVIFNGAEGLKPLSMCEVSLTVHNNKGKLPVEYNDVEITRRAYRDGESEYFINRTPCRLKDIHNLFIDTGMGSDAYSVIELSMIESILSETRDDRKRMFEEAAGINKYKLERRSAIRKFEAVRVDLDRINDIIGEVEGKVHGLALQLKRFKRHAKLAEKLREKDLALAFLRENHYRGQVSPLADRIGELKHLRESHVSSENLKETELARLKDLYRSQREEVDGLQKALNSIEGDREEARNSVLVKNEQKRSAEDNIARLEQEQLNIVSKLKQLDSSVDEHSSAVAKLDPEIEAQLSEYQASKLKLEQVETIFTALRKEVDALQNSRWQQQQKVSDSQSLQEKTKQLLTEYDNRQGRLNERHGQLLTQQAAGAEQQQQLEAEQEKLSQSLEKIKLEAERGLSDLNQAENSRREIEANRQESINKLQTTESQLKFYRELIEKNEGYPEGVRYVLDNRQEFPEIMGSLGDLINADPEHNTIIENALGPLAYCLVARDRETAITVLDRLQNAKAGHLSILPLKEISALKSEYRSTPKSDSPLLRAMDLIKFPPDIKALINYLLGNLLLVENIKTAVPDKALAGWDLIDQQGRYSGANSILKNAQTSGGISVIGRQQQIDTLTLSIKQLNKLIEKYAAEMLTIDAVITEHNEQAQVINTRIDEAAKAVAGVERELIGNHYQQSQTLEALQNITAESAELQGQIDQSRQALANLAPQISRDQAELTKIDKNIAATGDKLEGERINRDQLNQVTQDIRIAAMNLENQRENLQFQKRTATESITELKLRQTHIDTEITELNNQKINLANQITEGSQALDSINSKIKQQRSVLDLKQQVFDETYQSIEQLETKIRSEQKDREALLEDLRDCEVKSAQYTQQIQTIRERIREKYDIEIPEKLVVDQSIEELAAEVERTQRSIDSIGPINMAVQIEHDEEQSRLDLLIDQRQDLITSEENLQETIQKIDRVARKRFMDTFTLIKSNFERMFAIFFEGGIGTLTLTGDPDPLEAGIAIFAQPSGKRNQSLRILSAGEKALTAIALLFSIYQVKPSPYCILDEVDAPLDDVNIHKFTQVLKKFSDETQFIVVTHNKLTMEAANYLYGVTMERKGVSKLVSVKFDD